MNKPMTVPQKDSGTSTRRVGLYCRVSTDEQAQQGVSIEAQLAALRAWSNLKGWRMAGEYIDEGYSGTTDNRPDFQRLMLDAKLDHFDILAVSKLDRLMRNVRLFHKVIYELDGVGVGFVSIQEGIDTSDKSGSGTGRLFLNILAAFAEFESARIGERVKDARQAMIQSGRWPAGKALYGYCWNKVKQCFEIVEEEAAVVRLIFDSYVNKGMAQIPIASMLNEQHYRTRKGPWQANRVWAVLADCRYTGKDEHFTYPPIVGEDLYAAAQRRRKEARHILRNPGQHLLQGFVVCGLCGHKVSPRQWRGSGYRIYHCCGRQKKVLGTVAPECTLKALDADCLEQEVEAAIEKAFSQPEILEKHIRNRLTGLEAELRQMEQLAAPLKAEVDRLKGTMSRVGDRYESGELSKAEYDKKVAEYRSQLKALEARMPPADPNLQTKYRELQARVNNTRSLLEGTGWFNKERVRSWANWELATPGDFRAFLEKFEIKLWAFSDRVEIRGIIPTQALQRVLNSGRG